MTRKEALKMRIALKALLSFSYDGRYEVAIRKRFEISDNDEWEVHLFLREKGLSGFLNCALLSNAIEQISSTFLSTDSIYDKSTSGEKDLVPSIVIW